MHHMRKLKSASEEGGVAMEAQLNYVITEEAATDDGVIVGKFSINLIPVSVVFDSKVSHSFIHEGFVQDNKLPTKGVHMSPIT